jgi:hypothetical protein
MDESLAENVITLNSMDLANYEATEKTSKGPAKSRTST